MTAPLHALMGPQHCSRAPGAPHPSAGHNGRMAHRPRPENIQLGPLAVRLPAEHPDTAARERLAAGEPAADVARDLPASSLAWAVLAEAALPDAPVAAYAYARTGYHRGLDALRKAGWRGAGEIPADHPTNQGFLRALLALAEAAAAIGESDEAARCQEFLSGSGTTEQAIAALRA